MIEFGNTLRAAREAKGLTPNDIAARTHMMVQQIIDMENENFSKIAAPIYGRGFVRLYCEQVGLDPQPMIAEFMDIINGKREPVIRTRGAAPQRAPEPEPAAQPAPGPIVQPAPQPTVLPEPLCHWAFDDASDLGKDTMGRATLLPHLSTGSSARAGSYGRYLTGSMKLPAADFPENFPIFSYSAEAPSTRNA